MAIKTKAKPKKSETPLTPDAIRKIANKRWGPGAMTFASDPSLQITKIPCGILSIDQLLGGGFARGRHAEIFGGYSLGKTAIALYLIANVQRLKGNAAYIDSENTFDPAFARSLGVKIKKLAYHRQETGNRCIDVMELMLRSKQYDVIVLDSIAALLPTQEVDRNMEKASMGTQQAKMMSEALRRLTTANKQTVIVFLNQTRENIGCFWYNTPIDRPDGNKRNYIGRIVNNQEDDLIYSYDESSERVVKAKPRKWHNNGQHQDWWVQIRFPNFGDSRWRSVKCTPDHHVMTSAGWKKAKDITTTDLVMVRVPKILNTAQMSIVRGSILGDGHLVPIQEGRNAPSLRLSHNEHQKNYLLWKRDIFGTALVGPVGVRDDSERPNKQYNFDLHSLPELIPLARATEGNYFDQDFINQLGPIDLAIWYQDDGSLEVHYGKQYGCKIAAQRQDSESRKLLAHHLERFGYVSICADNTIRLSVEATKKFHTYIARYVHPDCQYKLRTEFRGRWREGVLTGLPQTDRQMIVPVPVKETGIWQNNLPSSMHNNRYDLGVPKTHTYFVNGLLVHNSMFGNRTVTSGGKAMGFYAGTRIELVRIENLKKTVKIIDPKTGNDKSSEIVKGHRVLVRLEKSKISGTKPHDTTTFVFDYGLGGIDPVEDLIYLGRRTGVVHKKDDKWYVEGYRDEQIKGRPAFKKWIRKNEQVQLDLRKMIKDKTKENSGGKDDYQD